MERQADHADTMRVTLLLLTLGLTVGVAAVVRAVLVFTGIAS